MRNWPLAAAWLLYAASLACPTIIEPHDYVRGYAVLINGWWILVSDFVAEPWLLLGFASWLTNFVFLATWAIDRHIRATASTPLVLAVPACFLLNVIAAVTVPGNYFGIFGSPGFYVWMSAFGVAGVALIMAVWQRRQKLVSTNA
jgi:hypothetical protein